MKNKNTKRIVHKTTTARNKPTPLSKIKTVDDLLASDNINEMLRDLDKQKSNISDLLIIYTEKDGSSYYDCTPHTLKSLAVYMLEDTKLSLMDSEKEDE